MINQTTATKLVKIYLTICQKYDNYLQYFCQRFSNNNKPVFTDQEVITILSNFALVLNTSTK